MSIAIIGASGKLGGATLSALLSQKLAAPPSIVALTSSAPGSDKWQQLAAKGVQVRQATFEDAASLEKALQGLDYKDAPPGTGRERHHKAAIDASVAAGVKHIYYSSLAFGNPSKSGVMRAHIRTEAYLDSLQKEQKVQVTVLREGLYNESWPLYLGYFFDPKNDERGVVKLSRDGKICWTAIADLGVANALVLTQPGAEWAGKTCYLSTTPAGARDMKEIAAMVLEARSEISGKKDGKVEVEIVGRQEHERHYVEDRGMDRPAVEWWSATYDALEDGECLIDDPTLGRLLDTVGEGSRCRLRRRLRPWCRNEGEDMVL
ncbi:NAD(P)-binding protein [Apiospora phragmitis]|uniref:NAD(P)-binding protein n=1 Tax=Apiospora phragmitis TaxID=2905665 RepID=A0ABR1WSS5_9PEZI